MSAKQQPETIFDDSARQTVELGNDILAADDTADAWEVASGLLAGAVQFWLFSRQPCDDPLCEACAEVSTARRRLELLLEEVRELAEDSDYFESLHDTSAATH